MAVTLSINQIIIYIGLILLLLMEDFHSSFLDHSSILDAGSSACKKLSLLPLTLIQARSLEKDVELGWDRVK